MLKKILPLAFLAFLLPCVAFADTLLDQKLDVISPDVLGLRLKPDLANQALKIDTEWPTTICIKQLNLIEKRVADTTVTYSAEVKSQDLDGAAYLEMWLHFPGATKAVVARSLLRPVKGTQSWTKLETSFALSKGQVPDRATLLIAINGRGTVWVKDVDLQRNP
jgi:hypothetical protein